MRLLFYVNIRLYTKKGQKHKISIKDVLTLFIFIFLVYFVAEIKVAGCCIHYNYFVVKRKKKRNSSWFIEHSHSPIGNLSKGIFVFDRRMSAGSGLFTFPSSGFAKKFRLNPLHKCKETCSQAVRHLGHLCTLTFK